MATYETRTLSPGISAREILGDTSGTAVPSGYIGQLLQAPYAGGLIVNNPSQGTGYDAGPSLVITAGTWLVSFFTTIRADRASGTGGTSIGTVLKDSSNTSLYTSGHAVNTGFSFNQASSSGSVLINTTGTTIKIVASVNQFGAANTYSLLEVNGLQTIQAVRIA